MDKAASTEFEKKNSEISANKNLDNNPPTSNKFHNCTETGSEHDEESVSDLQSVLNQITESLKTINQEMAQDDQNYNKLGDSSNVENANLSKKKLPFDKSLEKDIPDEKDNQNEKETPNIIEESSNKMIVDEIFNKNDFTQINVSSDKSADLSKTVNQENTSQSVKNIVQTDEMSLVPTDKTENSNNFEEIKINKNTNLIPVSESQSVINLDDEENDTVDETIKQDKKMETDHQSCIDELKTDEKSENNETSQLLESDKKLDSTNIDSKNKSTDKYVFYNKECIKYDCTQNCKIFYHAPNFILNFYKVPIKSNKSQFVCEDCYDESVSKYEEWCNILEDKQPLLKTNIIQKKNEFVEILDSSDEDDNISNKISNETGDFSESIVELLENHLDDTIINIFDRVNISTQLNWSKSILQQRLLKLQEDSDYITDTLTELQKNADNMNNTLYQCPKIEMKVLAPLDLNTEKTYILGEASENNQHMIPPMGEICRPKIELNGLYFAAKNKVMASWLPCTVVEFVDPPVSGIKNIQYYKVKFIKIKLPTLKSVPAKHMAYSEAPKVQLAIGTRVIALFDASTLSKTKDNEDVKSAFYPGIIAEALQSYNNCRYLIFFDDGYTQYVRHRDVRLICEASLNVWEDIHPGSREFIQNYLINYKKNRPMVQVKKGQSMITELNGKWIYAKVIDVDASLINMLFEDQRNHTEWIYRGSTRLGPLFKATQNSNLPLVTRMPRRCEPYVRYMQDDENALRRETAVKSTSIQGPVTAPVRAVAKKTTSRQDISNSSSAPVKHLNNSTIFVDDEEPKGKLVYYSAKMESNPSPKPYEEHQCNAFCITRKITIGHNYGVLSKPLLNGWERAIHKFKGKKLSVVYTAPCGRRLRTMNEVHKYLRQTKNALNVENFVFDPECGCLTEYQVQRCIVNKPDITEGKEMMPIQCVNYYDDTMPPNCVYSAVRIPNEGVYINTDKEFLVGCDCVDDCSDKSKCSCWKLTLEGAKYGNPITPINNVGYYYKRLPEPVPTGIYECNSRCKCSKQCINRVVQHPLETKLQVFKTSNRGWGLRCINDVPKGSFICIYAGDLLTEQKANEGGANSGDEYFAELDYIEVAEPLKQGYESDIPEENETDEEDQCIPENDSDEEFRPSKSVNSAITVNTRNRIKKLKPDRGNDEEDEQERIAINFEPNTSLVNYDEENTTTKYQSMRKLFGKHEYCYIMDAKNIGNVGRYFNHSCSPNLFVQNVFVDTHDLRFPWVAFFALSQIRAGTELTWNYNYEVGVVPGKVLYCECGAQNCRGRLL